MFHLSLQKQLASEPGLNLGPSISTVGQYPGPVVMGFV